MAHIPEPAGIRYPWPSKMARRGAYVIRFRIDGNAVSERTVVTDQLITIPFEEEDKRVYMHKIDLIPQENSTLVIMVVTVLDNVFPIVFLAKGAVVALGIGATWLTLDKVESVTSSTGGTIAMIGLSVLGTAVTVAMFMRSKR